MKKVRKIATYELERYYFFFFELAIICSNQSIARWCEPIGHILSRQLVWNKEVNNDIETITQAMELN